MLVLDPENMVAACELLQEELEQIERVASRFRADSEISHLNEAAGTTTRVSSHLFEAVKVALDIAQATDGAVDPTVGAALVRLGYDRDFAEIAGGVIGRTFPVQPSPGWESIELDCMRHTIYMPTQTQLDLGATAKALASDKSATRIFNQLGCGVLISLGGDIAVAGPPPPDGFSVGLADICSSKYSTRTVCITSGGLATSGTALRHWRVGDQEVHHIIDPLSGNPVRTPWRTVSVAAASCVQANGASTAAMVKGHAAIDWLNLRRLPARLVDQDGHEHFTEAWPTEDVSAVHESACS
jgi:thiamine biosynthesis lipoprotein